MTAGRLAGVLCVAALAAALAVAASTTAAAGDWSGDANLFFGRKAMNGGGWDPVNRQGEFGAEVTWGRNEWPIRIATDLLMSSQKKTESGDELKGSTTELDLGFRKVWDKKHLLHPFFGGGMAILTGNLKTTSAGVSNEERRNSSGVWAGGGVFWRFGPHVNLGAEARVSTGVIKFSGQGSDGGGLHVGVVLGFHWPGGK